MTKIQITKITASGSELEIANGLTFTSVEQADKVIITLVDKFDRGFAKTLMTVHWADGETLELDCEYGMSGTTLADMLYCHQYNNKNEKPLYLNWVSDTQWQARVTKWQAFVDTHEYPI